MKNKGGKLNSKKSISPAAGAGIAPHSAKMPQSFPQGGVGGFANPAMSTFPQAQAPHGKAMMPAYGAMQTMPPQSPCWGAGYPNTATAGALTPNSGPGMMSALPQGAGMQGHMGSFPGSPSKQNTMPGGNVNAGNNLPIMGQQESYIENILRLNLGKLVTIYMTFENNTDWNAKTFTGRLEAAGRDHIIISDPKTGKRYLLLMIYLDYVTFDEPIEYAYPYHTGTTE